MLLLRLWSVVWRLIALLIVWGTLLSPLALVGKNLFERSQTESGLWRWLAVESCILLALLIALWIMLRFTDRRSLASLGFRAAHFVRDSLLGMLIGAAMIAACLLPLVVLGFAEFRVSGAIAAMPLLLSAAAVLVNAATQELLARGYILQTIRARFSLIAAVVVSSLLFVVMHAPALAKAPPLASINLFLISIVFTLAYLKTENLWMPVALHFMWNFLLGPLFGLTVSGRSLQSVWQLASLSGPNIMTGGSFGLEGSVIATAVTVFTLILFLNWKTPPIVPA